MFCSGHPHEKEHPLFCPKTLDPVLEVQFSPARFSRGSEVRSIRRPLFNFELLICSNSKGTGSLNCNKPVSMASARVSYHIHGVPLQRTDSETPWHFARSRPVAQASLTKNVRPLEGKLGSNHLQSSLYSLYTHKIVIILDLKKSCVKKKRLAQWRY